jgi:uncharacterized membrane protein YtjA (UPF0391 family)
MLRWTTIFFITAIAAYFFGFGQIEGSIAGIARTLFFVFACLAVVSFLALSPRRSDRR